MAVVRVYGDPVLRRKAKPVERFDEGLKALVRELIVIMREKDGLGLAAPQIGESIRVAVIDPTTGEADPYVLVNPEVTAFSEDREDYEEGCLSIPDVNLKVNRPVRVSMKAFDEDGNEYNQENVEGIFARAIQHEIDHLDGILFVDRASPVLRQLVSGKLKKLAKSSRETSSVP